MTAVMIGPQSLDELESWVVPRFGQIPDRWLNKDAGDGKDEDGDIAATDDDKKWQAMKRVAAQLIGESAGDAPPVSSDAAVEPSSAFRPELQGGKWPVVVTNKPIQSVRKLDLLFPLPPTWNMPDKSPTSLLSHLFGHEGPGSPFAYLQDAGHITSLTAGHRISGPDQTLFQIGVNLTEEGENQWKEVAKVIFDYGRMVCRAAAESLASEEGDQCKNELRCIWDEVAALDRMRFHQTSPGAVYSFAPSVAQSISKHGVKSCLSAGNRLNENGDTLPTEETLKFCQRIIPENCIVERCSDGAWKEMEAMYGGKLSYGGSSGSNGEENDGSNFVFGKQTEKWYGVDYYVSPVNEEDVLRWERGSGEVALHLPKPNRYIPRSLELCEDLPKDARTQRIEKPIEPPKLIANKPNGRLWWRLDDRYALPKASVTILLRTATSENKLQPRAGPSANSRWDYDAEIAMQSRFLTNIFSDALAQDTYDSYLAGLGWSLSKSSSGFTLSCSGYSDRLSDLAIKILTDFCHVDRSQNFLKESHFITTKDKIVRGLKSYFESTRADSLALYYRDLLLSSKGDGVVKNLELAEAMELADVAKHHRTIWSDDDMVVDIFYTGNVSQQDAEEFFDKSLAIMERTRSEVLQERVEQTKYSPWVPGPFERRIRPGEEIELHFASENPKEENGAVIVTYQSQVEGFKGKSLSSEESLQQSAAIRLLCEMIKEPLFNELRTKQQLGYIVSNYYDVNYSSRQADFFDSSISSTASPVQPAPLTTSIDSLVVYVLSRKEEPTEVANRIDDFLLNFRSRLEEMSSSEIDDYANALALALTKPIRKLGNEASIHMSKIRRYGPETLNKGSCYSVDDLPWDNLEVLAGAIRKLDGKILLQVYDSLVMKKESRSRIKSFVYGKTFPLKDEKPNWNGEKFSAFSIEELMKIRKTLIAYDPSKKYQNPGSSLWNMLGKHKTTMRYTAAAAAIVGVGVWGTMVLKGKGEKTQKQG
mmetsp:Transcript_31398/g.66877  ORF Transcript_31398/g.66877 Transcript_31398/m.66877 type:complete len:988 (+) Transcript_31398:765-3728(+)